MESRTKFEKEIEDVQPGDTFKTNDGDILLVTFEEDNDESIMAGRFIVIVSLKTYTVISSHEQGSTEENVDEAVDFLNFLKCTQIKLNITES